MLFISKYFTTKGIFLNLQELRVHHLKLIAPRMTSLYGIVITDCIEQLPHNLTTLDITGCELSNDMQENLQVMLLLRVTMRGGATRSAGP